MASIADAIITESKTHSYTTKFLGHFDDDDDVYTIVKDNLKDRGLVVLSPSDEACPYIPRVRTFNMLYFYVPSRKQRVTVNVSTHGDGDVMYN